MSSEQAPGPVEAKRTSKVIYTENVNLQLKAGGIQYTIAQYQKELNMLNDRMRDLALEYNSVQAREEAETKLRAEIEAHLKEAGKPQLEVVPSLPEAVAPKPRKAKKSNRDQNLVTEVNQASSQSVSGAVPTQPQQGTDEQSQKKE